jgi:hypothetical protein
LEVIVVPEGDLKVALIAAVHPAVTAVKVPGGWDVPHVGAT